MNFLTVFLNDNGSTGSSGIGSKDDSISVLAAYDGGSCFFMGHGLNDIFFLKHVVSECCN